MVRRSTDSDLTAFDQKVLPKLEEWGWYVISVAAEPPFSYSIGLFEHFQHPEIILFGLDSKTGHGIINDAGRRIRGGHKYDVGVRYNDLLKDYDCEFRPVDPARYDGNLNYALHYYRGSSFSAVQLIWPDTHGRFPWESNFEEHFRADQPLLQAQLM
jgi:Domain of unknown function (DUF4262)